MKLEAEKESRGHGSHPSEDLSKLPFGEKVSIFEVYLADLEKNGLNIQSICAVLERAKLDSLRAHWRQATKRPENRQLAELYKKDKELLQKLHDHLGDTMQRSFRARTSQAFQTKNPDLCLYDQMEKLRSSLLVDLNNLSLEIGELIPPGRPSLGITEANNRLKDEGVDKDSIKSLLTLLGVGTKELDPLSEKSVSSALRQK